MKKNFMRGQNYNKVVFDDKHLPIIEEEESNVSDYLDNMKVDATPTMYASAEDHKRNMEHFRDVQEELIDDAVSALAPTDGDKKACGHHRTDRYITHERAKNMYVNPDKYMRFPKITESLAYNEYLTEDSNDTQIIPKSALNNGCDWVEIDGRYFWVNLKSYEVYKDFRERLASGNLTKSEKQILRSMSDDTLTPLDKYIRINKNIEKNKIKRTFDAYTNPVLLGEYTDAMDRYYSSHRELDALSDDEKFSKFLDYYAEKRLRDKAKQDPRVLDQYSEKISYMDAKKKLTRSLYVKAFIPKTQAPSNCKIKNEYPYPNDYRTNDDVGIQGIMFDGYIHKVVNKDENDDDTKNIDYTGLSFQDYVYAILYGEGEDSRLDTLEGVAHRGKYFTRRVYDYTLYMERYNGKYKSALDAKKVAIIPVTTEDGENTNPLLAQSVANRFNLPFETVEQTNSNYTYDKMHVITLQAGTLDLSRINLGEIARILKKTRLGTEQTMRIANITSVEKEFAEKAFGYTLDQDGVTLIKNN